MSPVGGAMMCSKAWVWPEAGMPGQVAREQCLGGWHRWGGGERKCSNMLPGDLLDGYQVMNDLICVPEFCPEFRFFEIA